MQQPNPYYRMYTQQPPFPTPEEKQPLVPPPSSVMPPEPLTLYGEGLTRAQWRRTRPHATRWLMAAAVTLLVLFALFAVSLAGYSSAVNAVFIGVLMLIALGCAVVGWQKTRIAEQEREGRERRLREMADKGGLVTTWYPDRVEQRGRCWGETLVFSPAVRYEEHEDFFFLTDGVHTVALRAADLTPAQAQAAYERVCAAVPPERQVAAGRFYAARTAPLSPKTIPNPVIYEQVDRVETMPEKAETGFIWWLTAAALVLAGLLTALFAVTPYIWLDYLLFFAGLLLLMTGASWLLLRRTRRERTAPSPAALVFTDGGLQVWRNGRMSLVSPENVRPSRTADGAQLFTPAGNFTFSWAAVANRPQMEWMLFGVRPGTPG